MKDQNSRLPISLKENNRRLRDDLHDESLSVMVNLFLTLNYFDIVYCNKPIYYMALTLRQLFVKKNLELQHNILVA